MTSFQCSLLFVHHLLTSQDLMPEKNVSANVWFCIKFVQKQKSVFIWEDSSLSSLYFVAHQYGCSLIVGTNTIIVVVTWCEKNAAVYLWRGYQTSFIRNVNHNNLVTLVTVSSFCRHSILKTVEIVDPIFSSFSPCS